MTRSCKACGFLRRSAGGGSIPRHCFSPPTTGRGRAWILGTSTWLSSKSAGNPTLAVRLLRGFSRFGEKSLGHRLPGGRIPGRGAGNGGRERRVAQGSPTPKG